jgi:UDP-N-acetylglucosamine--N-acetylmuramyl-(pentapeptide) pyrophosphoryl-undecaprenol N-acetylglucosamine transferase
MSKVDGTRILIAAGGTAGHVVPALAVAEALRARGAEVTFVGGQRAEAVLVPQAGFPLHTISVEGLSRTHPLRAARAVVRSVLATVTAGRIVSQLRPAAVMGGGGYVAGPVGLAALTARVPLVLTEADSHLGLANRLLARGARRVCLAFPPAAGRGAGQDGRYVVTGRPVFPVAVDRQNARQRLGIAADARCVLVFGGSLGARSVNLAAVEGLPALLAARGQAIAEGTAVAARGEAGAGAPRRGAVGEADAGLVVLHVCGRRDHPELSARELPEGYRLIEYLDLPDFDEALCAADLVVARSGGSVFEIAAHGLPAILIPYPHAAGDHQSANARWMSDAGAACVIPDAQLSAERLREQVLALLADRGRLASMAAASSALARPQAAAEIAEILLEAASS